MTEFYKKYRPKKFSEIIGQPKAVEQLSKWIKDQKTPHTILFTGPTGTGKTTAARILARRLNCFKNDRKEINAASSRGVDEARTIERNMYMGALSGGSLVWIIDEAHKLTGDAQNALLKPLEDTPNHVYFMIASSQPNKLIAAVRGRCTEVVFRALTESDILKVLKVVVSAESLKIPEECLGKIAEIVKGNARKALVLLEQASAVSSPNEQLELIANSVCEREAIELCRALMKYDPKNKFKLKWSEVAAVLKDLRKREENAEGIRQLVIAYATSVLLSGGKQAQKAYRILNFFRDDYYSNGMAGLCLSAYEFVHAK